MEKHSNNQIDISVIIVSFNTRELLQACLSSIYSSSYHFERMEIIVIDNASVDGSTDMIRNNFPDVHLISEKTNLGFSKANNIGLRQSTGKYVMLLNSDTEISPDTLRVLVNFMDRHSKAGAATARLVLPNGRIDPACHRGLPTPWASFTYMIGLEKVFPKNRLFSGYHLGYLDFNQNHEVDVVSGACMIVPRKVIREVGILDEAYFMYAEDIDWCYRIKRAGWQIWYIPETVVLHRKKQSGRLHVNRTRRWLTQRMFHVNNRLFYRKHFKNRYPFFVTWLIEVVYAVRIGFLNSLHI